MFSYLSSFVWPAAQPAEEAPPPAPSSLPASPFKRRDENGDADEGGGGGAGGSGGSDFITPRLQRGAAISESDGSPASSVGSFCSARSTGDDSDGSTGNGGAGDATHEAAVGAGGSAVAVAASGAGLSSFPCAIELSSLDGASQTSDEDDAGEHTSSSASTAAAAAAASSSSSSSSSSSFSAGLSVACRPPPPQSFLSSPLSTSSSAFTHIPTTTAGDGAFAFASALASSYGDDATSSSEEDVVDGGESLAGLPLILRQEAAPTPVLTRLGLCNRRDNSTGNPVEDGFLGDGCSARVHVRRVLLGDGDDDDGGGGGGGMWRLAAVKTFDSDYDVDLARQEIRVHRLARGRGVVEALGVSWGRGFGGRGSPMGVGSGGGSLASFAMECLSHGTVETQISLGHRVVDEQLIHWTRSLLKVVVRLHGKRIVHGDIKVRGGAGRESGSRGEGEREGCKGLQGAARGSGREENTPMEKG
jgi:hypothetical protein